MRPNLPPDRDSYLREALSLTSDDQVRLLQHLSGEPETHSTLRPTNGFTHYGAIMKTGPHGAFVYAPIPIPPAVADADAHTLTLTVDHGGLDRREQPRVPTTIAKLKALIDAALPFRGTHVFPVQTPPRRWTADHLEWLVREMAQFLPPSHKQGQPVGFELYGVKSNSLELRVLRATDRYAFRVTCELSPVALRPALDSWQYVTNGTSAILGHEPLTRFPEPPDQRGDPEAAVDGDLDAIEQACRRRLHGDSPTNEPAPEQFIRRASHDPANTGPLDFTNDFCDVAQLARVSPEAFTILARMARSVIRIMGETS